MAKNIKPSRPSTRPRSNASASHSSAARALQKAVAAKKVLAQTTKLQNELQWHDSTGKLRTFPRQILPGLKRRLRRQEKKPLETITEFGDEAGAEEDDATDVEDNKGKARAVQRNPRALRRVASALAEARELQNNAGGRENQSSDLSADVHAMYLNDTIATMPVHDQTPVESQSVPSHPLEPLTGQSSSNEANSQAFPSESGPVFVDNSLPSTAGTTPSEPHLLQSQTSGSEQHASVTTASFESPSQSFMESSQDNSNSNVSHSLDDAQPTSVSEQHENSMAQEAPASFEHNITVTPPLLTTNQLCDRSVSSTPISAQNPSFSPQNNHFYSGQSRPCTPGDSWHAFGQHHDAQQTSVEVNSDIQDAMDVDNDQNDIHHDDHCMSDSPSTHQPAGNPSLFAQAPCPAFEPQAQTIAVSEHSPTPLEAPIYMPNAGNGGPPFTPPFIFQNSPHSNPPSAYGGPFLHSYFPVQQPLVKEQFFFNVVPNAPQTRPSFDISSPPASSFSPPIPTQSPYVPFEPLKPAPVQSAWWTVFKGVKSGHENSVCQSPLSPDATDPAILGLASIRTSGSARLRLPRHHHSRHLHIDTGITADIITWQYIDPVMEKSLLQRLDGERRIDAWKSELFPGKECADCQLPCCPTQCSQTSSLRPRR